VIGKKLRVLCIYVSCIIVLTGLAGCNPTSSTTHAKTITSTSAITSVTTSMSTTTSSTPATTITITPITTSAILTSTTTTFLSITTYTTFTTTSPTTTIITLDPHIGDSLVAITNGPDGNLWFNEPFFSKIGKISPVSDVIIEYNVSGYLDNLDALLPGQMATCGSMKKNLGGD